MTEPTDLLPCPFCGGAASLHNDTDSPCWFVGCSNSACPIEPCHYADTEAEAIATWNRRTPTPVGVGPYGYVDADRAITEIDDSIVLDAMRYRWLRHGDNDEKVLKTYTSRPSKPGEPSMFLPRNGELDRLIDTARATQEGKSHDN